MAPDLPENTFPGKKMHLSRKKPPWINNVTSTRGLIRHCREIIYPGKVWLLGCNCKIYSVVTGPPYIQLRQALKQLKRLGYSVALRSSGSNEMLKVWETCVQPKIVRRPVSALWRFFISSRRYTNSSERIIYRPDDIKKILHMALTGTCCRTIDPGTIDCCIVVWSHAPATLISKVQSFQTRAARITSGNRDWYIRGWSF